jgi:hypothetical protein
LFFDVLAREQDKREQDVKAVFANVPYLNSSLFEPTETEQQTIDISNLKARSLPIFGATVLTDGNDKKRSGDLNALEYLFEFLHAYKFNKDEFEDGQEDSEKLINAAVLGLIFEKINGYKDGSFYTPSFITMYMCRETIRRAVVQKFNEVKGWSCENIQDLCEDLGRYIKGTDRVVRRNEANGIVNSLKICDPAVGSGHFLVSALNEMIAIKQYLGILQDRNGESLSKYEIEVVNDKLKVTLDNKLFAYNPKNKESQRVQEALFHEKQTIIEGCLFGVDINPNSVKICQLRLWIELLKNAYYRVDLPQASLAIDPPQPPLIRGEKSRLKSGENINASFPPFTRGDRGDLETLPNIDINIKVGNSLISRFGLDVDVKQVLQKQKFSIEQYRNAVQTYRSAESKAQKREMEGLIAKIKAGFSSSLLTGDPKKVKLRQLQAELYSVENQMLLLEETKAEVKAREKRVNKLNNEIDKLSAEIEDIESGRLYENALEWRFEFPEVLNDDGDFVGFDVVIGNPPYGVVLTANQQAGLNKIYNYGTTETAILFILKGYEILNNSGSQSYIIPKSFTFASNYQQVRQFTVDKLEKIVDCGKVWQDVKLEVCIFQLNKNHFPKTYNSLKLVNYDIEYLTRIDKNLVIEFGFFLNGLSDVEINIGLKILKTSQFLNDISKNQRGIMAQKLISDIGNTEVIGGAEVQKYGIRGIKGKIDREIVNDEKAFIKPNSILVQNIIAHILNPKDHIQITASIPDGKDYILVDTINQIEIDKYINQEFVWALLHSKLVNWYVYLFIFSKAVRTMHFDNQVTEKIPIPKNIDKKKQQPLIKLVCQILTAKKGDRHADTSELEKAINNLVYKLYQLTYDEVKIIDSEFELTEQEYTAIKTG